VHPNQPLDKGKKHFHFLKKLKIQISKHKHVTTTCMSLYMTI